MSIPKEGEHSDRRVNAFVPRLLSSQVIPFQIQDSGASLIAVKIFLETIKKNMCIAIVKTSGSVAPANPLAEIAANPFPATHSDQPMPSSTIFTFSFSSSCVTMNFYPSWGLLCN